MAKYRNTEINACPVAEGVRFQLGNATAFGVRTQNKEIAVRVRRERHPLRRFWQQVPFARGILRLFIVLFGFLDSISESAEMKPQEISKGSRFTQRFAELFRIKSANIVAFFTSVLVIIIMLGLVAALPRALETHVLSLLEMSRAALNVCVTATRVIGLMAAMIIIMRLRILRRFCMYQGAINKVLNAYERKGKALTFDDCMKGSCVHPKSDGVFLLLTAILSMIAFACLRTYTLHIQVLVRILVIMAIAAIVNEPMQLLEDSDPDAALPHVLLMPVYGLQRMFVIEPHPQMVETAFCAFNAVRENDVW